MTSTQVSGAIANETIAKPVLQLRTIPANPGESVEEYTRRMSEMSKRG